MQSPLPLIYDTATSLGKWRRALDAVAEELDAKAIALKIRRPHPGSRDLDMLSSAYLNFSRSPSGLYYGLRFARLQNPDWEYLRQQPAHSPTLDSTLPMGTATLDERKDYAFLRGKIGVRRRLGIRLNSDRVWFDAISIAFDKSYDDIPESAVTEIGGLLPHMTKAVELSRIFAQLQSRYKAVLTALDHVRIGLAVALPGGDIIVRNTEADRILDMRDGLWMDRDGYLRCLRSEQGAELADAIAQVARTAAGHDRQCERLVMVQRKSGRDPFMVDVSPLRDSRAELDIGLDGALITIIDPGGMPRVKIDRFAALYDLTPAETEVCGLILDGCSVAEIAEMRNTAPVTAKNQVATVLAKAGFTRRVQFIRMVMRVLPPVD